MRLLLVEDAERPQRLIGRGLRRAGYAVDVSHCGVDGLRRASSTDYDVLILNSLLPGIDGVSVVRRLRDQGRDTHVLLLTARDAVDERVAGLRAGADDCLAKPFAFDELLARVEALGRRQRGRKSAVLRVGPLQIDAAARTLSCDGRPIPLLPREFTLLAYLADRAGQVVSRADIEAHIYDDRTEPMSNVVDSAVCALRRKIDPPAGPSLITTRRRLGYVLVAAAG